MSSSKSSCDLECEHHCHCHCPKSAAPTGTSSKLLTVEQQKELFHCLSEKITSIHTNEFKNELKKTTEPYRQKNKKGIVLLDYTDTKQMVTAVKEKSFFYEWIDQSDALRIGHSGIAQALSSMHPTKDCVLVCSLSLGKGHIYLDCVKIADI